MEWIKEPSAIEEKAYRDTWGKGLDSYLQMMYDRLVLMRDLLSDRGSIYVKIQDLTPIVLLPTFLKAKPKPPRRVEPLYGGKIRGSRGFMVN